MRFVTVLVILCAPSSVEAVTDFSGKWVTDYGHLTIRQEEDRVEGVYGDQSTLHGTVEGRRVTFEFQGGNSRGRGSFEMNDDGHSFTGEWTAGNASGNWRGWRPDPEAPRAKMADFSGYWRTSYGIMEVIQKGRKVSGRYGSEGWNTFKGTVQGRRMNFTFKGPRNSGDVWIELTSDDQGWFGGPVREDEDWKWLGQRLEGYGPKVVPEAEKIAQGVAANNMLYYLRAPKGYELGSEIPAIVILHGSNMSARSYVATIASAFPALAADFMIIGIDGESWVDTSPADAPRNNYTYINWMGRSTYKGYPNTHRESPALVAEVVEELQKDLDLTRIYIGGHSQGGYLTYAMHMHFPEMFAGTFPMSCEVMIQCVPDVFDDAKLQKAQRETPLAIIHGRNDNVVKFSGGKSAFETFREHNFPRLALFDHASAGHMFALLPVEPAIRWLEALSTDDTTLLIEFASKAFEEKRYRDTAAAVLHARQVKGGKRAPEIKEISKQLDAMIEDDAKRFRKLIERNRDASWVDEFLVWRDQFEFAPAARGAMTAYTKLRARHEAPARTLRGEARRAFQDGKRDEGWAKYEELVQKYYASSLYRRVQGWLKDR